MLVFVLGLWYAVAAIRGAAAFRMLWNRLAWRYPFVFGYLAFCFLQACALLFTRGHRVPYTVVYTWSIPIGLAFQTICIVAVFWIVTERYLNFRLIGTAVLSAFGVIGIAGAVITRLVGVPHGWTGTWQAMTLMQRYCTAPMAIALAGAMLAVTRYSSIPIRRSALRAGILLVFDIGYSFAFSAWVVATEGRHGIAAAAILAPALNATSGILWTAFMTKASDGCAELLPFTEREIAEMADEKRALAAESHIDLAHIEHNIRKFS